MTTQNFFDWEKTHNFDNCQLNRKEYGEFLSNYITSQKEGFVLNLNGAWGSGKTEFLKRLYSAIKQKEHPVVYIDAWESDFSECPLSVLSCELVKQLESYMQSNAYSPEETKQMKVAFGKALKLSGFALASTLGLNPGDLKSITDALNDDSNDDQLFDQFSAQHQAQMDTIKELKQALSKMTDNLCTPSENSEKQTFEAPVVILIDELDRCRPSYAIKLLETIKHFFEVKNFVFLIATDTEQLCHSIKAVYGNGFDAHRYLKRFFQRTAALDMANIEDYIKVNASSKPSSSAGTANNSSKKIYPALMSNKTLNFPPIISAIKFMTTLAHAYKLSIRDVDQLLFKYEACFNEACNSSKKFFNVYALMIGIIEHDQGFACFEERTNYHRVYEPVKNSPIDSYINTMMKSVTLFSDSDKSEANKLPTWRVINDTEIAQTLDHSVFRSDCVRWFSQAMESEMTDTYSQPSQFFLWEDLKRLILMSGKIT